jgi:endogenous inhibitor of DNA gyrase (YacG/DUF329 family)
MNVPLKQTDEIFCPECAKPVKRDAVFCANCGIKIKNIDISSSAKTEYNIGDTGPAGGFIFYINPKYENEGWRYFEAAPGDLTGDNSDCRIQWQIKLKRYDRKFVVMGATQTAIGTGKANTQKIVDILGDGYYAAKLCYSMTLNGYSDWFLPSKDELNLIYENLYLKGTGSFEPDVYWSSSGDDANDAWYQYFDNGNQYDNSKHGIRRVRAVRAF